MAGGEGTRLRPLTSNQPKPMVPIVGKPCMEHILELLKLHGLEDTIVTVAFLPQAIRSYFGSGETLGMDIGYSVEETPLGTAGSVRLAAGQLDDTFLVISGDALCDIDLTRLIAYHREKKASVTIGLKAVDNPLEFGIVVTDDDGRVERFLEKPSWGQVFSDTINTGIYVLEPEVLDHVPTDRPYDFSKELFPLLLEMGRPIYGCVLDGYWQDIGNLDQYRQANFDALDERVRLNIGGIRIRGNVWIGDGVDVDDLEAIGALAPDARGRDRYHRPGLPRPDAPMRPMPRPQVRPGHPRDYYALYGIFASTSFPWAGSRSSSQGLPAGRPLVPPVEAGPARGPAASSGSSRRGLREGRHARPPVARGARSDAWATDAAEPGATPAETRLDAPDAASRRRPAEVRRPSWPG